MARHPLLGGSYATRSVIASAQRRINYYPERNPKWALAPVTHYQRPGLTPVAQIGTGPIRQIYRPSNGVGGYIVSGNQLWFVNANWLPTLVGNITMGVNTPASLIDNGISGMIVDGSNNGWYWTLASPGNTFTQIVDSTGLFVGANKLDYIDTFILFNIPGTNLFGSTLSNQIVPFDATYFAGKTDYPDPLQSLIVNRHEILLMGQLKSETWYDAGNPLFPFAELPGSYIEHGLAAIYSLASQDISVYWLAMNLQGQGMVMRYRGYSTTRVSNSAVEYAIQQMALKGKISDAIGFTYQQNGHVFYVLTFPTGNQTWVFDESMEDPVDGWHQEAWTDPRTGQFNRHRANCAAFINGMNVVGDWQNNTIYNLDQTSYVDKVNGNPQPINCVATFPHIGAAMAPSGQMVEYDGKRMQINAFLADFEGGTTQGGEISLRWSLDRGKTWGNKILQSAGNLGDYDAQPVWRDLGISRYPVFELSHAINGPAALNGAWIDAKVLGT